MKLKRLEAEYYKCYEKLAVEFQSGFGVIIGPTGAGKSSIVEAIIFAFFNRGFAKRKDDCYAKGKEKDQLTAVEVVFEHDGDEYRIRRVPEEDESLLYKNETLIAEKPSVVNEEFTEISGYDLKSTLYSVVAQQKELDQVLVGSAREKKRMLMKATDIPNLFKVIEKAKNDENISKGKSDEAYKEYYKLADVDIQKEIGEAEEEVVTRKKELEELEDSLEAAQEQEITAEENWQLALERKKKMISEYEEYNKSQKKLASVEAKIESAEKTIATEVKDYGEPEEITSEIKEAEKATLKVSKEMEGYQQRKTVEASLNAFDRSIENDKRKLAVLAKSGSGSREKTDIKGKLNRAIEVSVEIGRATGLMEFADAMEGNIRRDLESAEDGICPICASDTESGGVAVERLREREEKTGEAKKHYSEIRERKENELKECGEDVSEEIKLFREVCLNEGANKALVSEAEELKDKIEKESEERDKERKRLAGLPEKDPTPEAEELNQKKLELEKRLLNAKNAKKLAEQKASAEKEKLKLDELRQGLAKAVGLFDKKQWEEMTSKEKEAHDNCTEAGKAVKGIEKRISEANFRLKEARSKRKEAESINKRKEEQEKHIGELDHETNLNGAVQELIAELTDLFIATIRPKLEKYASEILDIFTAGYFSGVKVDEDLNISVVSQEGEPLRHILSGGEGDSVFLAIRLAIQRIVCDLKSTGTQFVIFDEVFGHLDEEHQENVLDYLSGVGERYEQVLMVTHLKSVADYADYIIRAHKGDPYSTVEVMEPAAV